MYRECSNCHLTFDHPKFFIFDENRCNPCQKKYEKKMQKKPISKVVEVVSDHDSEDATSLPENEEIKISSDDENMSKKVKGRRHKKVAFSDDDDYNEIIPKKKTKNIVNTEDKKAEKVNKKSNNENGKGKAIKGKAD